MEASGIRKSCGSGGCAWSRIPVLRPGDPFLEHGIIEERLRQTAWDVFARHVGDSATHLAEQEESRSPTLTPLASRVSELVVTSYWSLVSTVVGMGTSGLNTGLDGENANGNGVSTCSVHRRRSLAPHRLRPTSAAARGGPRRRPAAGAVGRSRHEVADRSPSGVRPPAGIKPGNRHGQRPPGEPPSRSSKDGSRCGSQLRLPDETGQCC
jgi:hypothetical protein